jgi:hypothetical protein
LAIFRSPRTCSRVLRTSLLASTLLVATAAMQNDARAQQEFYRGKTVNL